MKTPLIALAILAAPVVGNAQTVQPYFISTLQVPTGASSISSIVSIDEAGNAYGNAIYKGGQEIPTVWQAVTRATHTLPDTGTGYYADGVSYSVYSSNRIGGAVGMGVNSSGTSGGVYWDANGHPSELLATQSVQGVSDNGVVVGIGDDGSSYGTATYWNAPIGNPVFLPFESTNEWCLEDATLCNTYATAVSPNGRYIIGGVSIAPARADYILMWDGGKALRQFGPGYAQAVNNSGVVVGSLMEERPDCPNDYGYPQAFMGGTAPEQLLEGLVPGACEIWASSVNSHGVVVGGSATYAGWDYNAGPPIGSDHAVRWVNGKITDLQTVLAPVLPSNTVVTAATKITDSGKILLQAINTTTNVISYVVATPTIPTRITISSNINPSSYGQQIHLVASVIPSSGGVPLGNVTWYDGGKLVATAGLTKIGTASWEPSTLSPGVHKITVKFAGYNPDGPSTSAVFNQTVHAATTKTTLSSTATSVTHGQSFTLTATVVPAFGTIAGSVTFKAGSTTLGAATLNARTKQARLTTSIKAAGKYSVTAVYGGTSNFAGSRSAVVAFTVK